MTNSDNAPDPANDLRDTTHDDAVSPPPVPAAEKPAPDLTKQILASVAKEAGDVVRCTRVGEDTYRCNWWAPQEVVGFDNPALPGRLFTTHRIRKSQFLAVSRDRGGLLIRVVPDADAGAGSRAWVASG